MGSFIMSELSRNRVTVAIPAYNSAATLDQTLLSVRSQSYRDLEIIIVDDGSSDGTYEIARHHAQVDPRIILISQPNGGVSTARNAALARATGELFFPIDADDLWHRDMISQQIRSIRNGRTNTVLSYTWYFYVDENNQVLSAAERIEEGNVIGRMVRGNLVGTGSSAIMLTKVLRDVGGWDPKLRHGNEDYKTFFLMAERGDFTVVRSHLLGYRQTRGSRSSNAWRMLSSYDEVLAEFRPRYPEYAAEFSRGRAELIAYFFDKAVLDRRWKAAAYLIREAWQQSRADAWVMLRRCPLIVGRMILPLNIRVLLRPRKGGSAQMIGRPFLME
jgi:glycosyltransferase involved in cell wall biosynthesis